MASVRKHKSSQFWYACILLPDGRQRQFSTGLTDKAEALAAAVAAERALKKHRGPSQLRAALDRIAGEFEPATATPPADFLLAWAAARKAEVSASTFKSYKATADLAAGFLRARGITSFSAISTAVVTAMRDQWAIGNSATTANGKLKRLGIMLGAAVAAKLMDGNPAAHVARLREKATRRRAFTIDELSRLIPTLSPEWRAMVLLGFYTGQRLNDLAEMTWRNLDTAAGTITFTAQKTGHLVSLPLATPALDAVLALPSSEQPGALVFPRLGAMSRGARSNAFRAALAEIGLAKPRKRGSARAVPDRAGSRETGELSFHSLRHTATTALKASGVADSIARAIIGHQSQAVSQTYTHLDAATMRRAIDKMPAIVVESGA